MTREEALDKLCHSYSGYFDVVRHEEPKGHLVAEAGLHIHSEKYVLVKAAKLWEADNNEYVYIFSVPVLTKEIFEQCREQARADGMQRIEPGPNHMCSYITAIFLCDTCEPDALRALRRAGVNRLSLGVQSTDDALLQAIGRVHTFAQVQEAVAAARRAKIKNLSLDLIYGLPGQTMAQWEKTLQDAVDLQPEHLSCYGLKLEPGTPLFARQGELTFPDDDAQADMYLYTVAFLKEHGYEQYEISNFAKPGFASKHNLKYWLLQEYAGFGPGAHSDFGDVRYGYLRDIDRYIAGELVLSERETISRRERDMEYIMLRLRLARGADPREFENAFRERFNPLAKLLHQYAAHGLACQNDDGSWRLTPKGFLVSNQIIGALQEELSREKADRLARAARGDYRVID